MADPVIPPDTVADVTGAGDAALKTADDFAHLNSTVSQSGTAFVGMSSVMNSVQGAFSSLNSVVRGFGISLKDTAALTNQQREQFNLAAIAAIGAKESFTNFSTIDSTGVNTFSAQIKELHETLTRGGTISAAALNGLSKLVKNLGASDSDIAKATKDGASGLLSFAQSFIVAADNGARFQNAILKMAGATGGLGEVYRLAGKDLHNMNALMSKHQDIINDAQKATGKGTEQVQQYYAALGMVPQALNSLVKSGESSRTSMNMLTATIKLADGAGYSYADTIQDLKVAFKDYGLVGENALKFSAQMGEVSNNLGVELETVRGALKGTADVFKMFANNQKDATTMASGFANILNNYSSALEKTGFSGTQAISVIKNMTDQMGNLNIAQKAFLSAQSGGPGGLMGGFQIEKLMREDPAKVVEMMRAQMKKLSGGRIVSGEEATQSQAGAAQYQKQLMMLQQGPFGALAKTPQEAEKLLAAFGELDKGGSAKGLADNIVQETMKKGTSVEEKTATIMSDINADVAAIRSIMDNTSYGMVQKAMAAGTGTGEAGKSAIGADISNKMRGAAEMGKNRQAASLSATADKKLIDTSGQSAVRAINNFSDTLSADTMSAAIKQPLEVLKKAFTSDGKNVVEENVDKAREDLVKDIAKRKADAQKLSLDKRGKLMAEINKEEEALQKIDATIAQMKSPLKPEVQNRVTAASRGAQVGAAAGRAVAAKPPGGVAGDAGVGRANSPPEKMDVEVTVKGIVCEHCSKPIISKQGAAANKPASTQ